MRGWELLSIAASLKAQQLAATAQGNVGILKESRGYFVTSARYVRVVYGPRSCIFLFFILKIWSESV